MKNSKVLLLLKSLTSDEMKGFGKYIVYKSTNKQSRLLDFYNYLKKYHPEFPEKFIDKNKVSQKLYPKEANGLKNINNLIFNLKPLLKNFMIQIELEKQPVEKEFLFLKALKSRKETKLFFTQTDKLEKDWSKGGVPGIEHLLNLYKLKKMRFSHPGFLEQSEFTNQPNVIIKQLEQFFIAEKIYWTLNGHFTGIFLGNADCNDNEQSIPLEKLINEVERKHLAETKQIQLLAKIFNSVVLNKTVQYDKMEHGFFENYKQLDYTEVKELVTYLAHICYKNHLGRKEGALNDLFRINNFAIEQKLFLQDDIICSDTFHNVINTALAANELEWVRGFIDEYSTFIQESERIHAVALAKAKYYFHCNELEKGLKLLLTLKYVTIFYALQGNTLELQIYFEMEDIENFRRIKSAFKDYLWRKKREGILPEEQKDSFLNFVKFTSDLNECIFMKDKERLKKLQSEIADCSLLINKAWLMEKVALSL